MTIFSITATLCYHKSIGWRKNQKNKLAGAIHAYCRAAAFGQIGKYLEELQKIVFEMKKEMNGKPFIGGFTAGEQGNIKGYGCFHGNLSSSMVIFGEN